MNRRDPERVLEFFGGVGDCLLVVEGKRDARALNTLGLKNILAINGRPLIAIVDMVAGLKANHKYSDIIVLTDFDREGRHMATRLGKLLRAYKIHPNQRLRSRIMKFGFNKIEDIRMDSILALGGKSACGRRSLPIENSACGWRRHPIEKSTYRQQGFLKGSACRGAAVRLPIEKERGDDYVKAGSNFNKIRDKGFDKGEGRRGKAGHHRCGVRSD